MNDHHPRYARATIGGHPIHVMLVSFPIAFYVTAFGSLIVHAETGSMFAYQLAFMGFLGGAAIALVAAIFGVIDLTGIPRETPAIRTGIEHLGLNVLSVALFGGAGGMLYVHWRELASHPSWANMDVAWPLALSAAGLVCTAISGWLGWKLVQTHHVGVDDGPYAAGAR
jgi:uncharacterized membrane protein